MQDNSAAVADKDWLTAKEAATLLGISLPTLYSYVSRDLLHPIASPIAQGGRGKRYRRAEVERLARHHEAARDPRRVAGGALDFGLPVLQSGLSLIEHGRLYYRGIDAAVLAETAGLEDVAKLLWSYADRPLLDAPSSLKCGVRTQSSRFRSARTPGEMLEGFHQAISGALHLEVGKYPESAGWWLVQAMFAAATGQEGSSEAPLHEQLQRAWDLPAAAADELRRALVLCADHDLNASSFTARCVASTGATPAAAVAAALAALTGPRHGGMTARLESWWPQMELNGDAPQRLQTWLAGQPPLPGFGHTLYPEGDPRAAHLLQRLPRDERRERFMLAEYERTGKRPNVDFALVALRRSLGAPEGAALAIFAIGRTVGWLAHAFEQKRSGELIRPRAAYVGPIPVSFESSSRRNSRH